MDQNRPGPITKDLLTFARGVQAWYQGEGNHLASSPEDHSTGSALTRLASRCLRIGSIQLPSIREPHQFPTSSGRGTLNLIATITGKYLTLLVRDRHQRTIAAGITHLARYGMSFIRVDETDEYIRCLLDLDPMNDHIVTIDTLIETLKETPPYRIPSSDEGETICFTNLRDELTLQTYATIRRWTEMRGQPVTVNCLSEALYLLASYQGRSACLVQSFPFETQIAAFLLGDALERAPGEPLMQLFGFGTGHPDLEPIHSDAPPSVKDDDVGRMVIIGSSPSIAEGLKNAVKRNLYDILARTERMPG
jgi:hypothetical protein